MMNIHYVSSSLGSDSNDGLSPDKPFKTVAKGKSSLPGESSIHLLFKRGDTWEESFGQFLRKGKSESEPLVIGSYGDSNYHNPLFLTGISSGVACEGGKGGTYSHVIFKDLDFYAHHRDPKSPRFATGGGAGFSWVWGTEGLTIDNCTFSMYSGGMAILRINEQFPLSNVLIKNCRFLDSYSPINHSQGIFINHVNGLIIDNNLFDHNGWLENVAWPTMFNHNMYLSSWNRNVKVINNISARAASHGVQLRPGGVVKNNLFIQNSIAILIGSHQNPVDQPPVDADVSDNIILEGKDITSTLSRGWGIHVERRTGNQLFKNNIVSHVLTDSKNRFAFDHRYPEIFDESNISYNWDRTESEHPKYRDPKRKYQYFNSTEEFLLHYRTNRFDINQINNYIREGFKVSNPNIERIDDIIKQLEELKEHVRNCLS